MSITLFHCHEARSMRSLWLLNELGLEFELVVMPFDGLRSQEYLAVNQLGRVPALKHNGMTLIETGAICQHLCETFSPEELGRMPSHPERAEWLQWLHYSETMAVHGANLVQQYIVLQDESLRSPIIQKLERKRLQKSVGVIEYQLDERQYLLSSGFSAVDIAVGYSLHLARRFISLLDFPQVETYYQRLAKRPAFLKSLPQSSDELRIFSRTLYE